jgi:hypothetical protein
MDNISEELVILETQSEPCLNAGEKIFAKIDFLANSKSNLAKTDANLYYQLLQGNFEGFEGLYFFGQNPSPGTSGMIETVTLVPLGEKSWGFIVDSEQIKNNSDEDLVLALIDESVHAQQRITQISQIGQLKETDMIEYQNNEIDARMHVIEVYRELSQEGFKHELYDDLVQYIDLKTFKHPGDKEKLTREIVKEFLVRSGYKF